MLIEPSPEQFAEWLQGVISLYPTHTTGFIAAEVARKAYRAGADMELDKCCEWLSGCGCDSYGRELHDARRPPSLKELALQRLEIAKKYVDIEPILRALEKLPND